MAGRGLFRREGLEVAKNGITEVTRRSIVDYFSMHEVSWSGRFNDADFLGRLYDLAEIPSRDHRYANAYGDIFQHRVNNYDWDSDWVFYDTRFNLLHVPDEEFLRFLCETVHPVVRTPQMGSAHEIVEAYNEYLERDGWEIVEVKQISGRPVFAGKKRGTRHIVFDEPTGWQKVDRQVQGIRLRLEEAPSEELYQTVGLLCREALISVAQEVYDAERYPTLDGVQASKTDAKRMLEAIIQVELHGSANDEARAHAKAAMNLALALQHKRSADFRMAALCAEATLAVTNLLAVLAGRRGRPFA